MSSLADCAIADTGIPPWERAEDGDGSNQKCFGTSKFSTGYPFVVIGMK